MGPQGWTAGGTNSDWAHGVPSSGPNGDHSGGGSLWGTDLGGTANTCQSSYLQSPAGDLSANAGDTVYLRVWHWHDFRESTGGLFCDNNESDSGGIVQINSGAGWTKLVPMGGYDSGTVNCTGGNGACGACDVDGDSNAFTGYGLEQQWRESIFDVSAHLTSSVQIRFLFGSHDGYACYPSGAGWYVDDVEIFTPMACP